MPTIPPLGSQKNPIIMGFILQPDDTVAIKAAEDIALLISENTGYRIESAFYPDYRSFSNDVIENRIHLLWLEPLPYLHLHDRSGVEVLLMTNHLGVYAYGVQFLTNIYRGFRSFYDPETNQSTGTALQALQQFSGTRPCYINEKSLPGYYVPLGLLFNTSTPTLEPVLTRGYSAIIRSLYIQGICDFGVTYALTGDPRSASDVLQDLGDAREVVTVIWQSDGIIPNTNLSITSIVPDYMRVKLEESFLDLQNQPEGLSLVSTALIYDVQAFQRVSDSFYNPLRELILPLELDLEAIIQN
jgi:phosphonate transport system substrate-binding protein